MSGFGGKCMLGIDLILQVHKTKLLTQELLSGKHGATTETQKRYIDFAAKMVLTFWSKVGM
jgi:hypothetical protein